MVLNSKSKAVQAVKKWVLAISHKNWCKKLVIKCIREWWRVTPSPLSRRTGLISGPYSRGPFHYCGLGENSPQRGAAGGDRNRATRCRSLSISGRPLGHLSEDQQLRSPVSRKWRSWGKQQTGQLCRQAAWLQDQGRRPVGLDAAPWDTGWEPFSESGSDATPPDSFSNASSMATRSGVLA